VIPVARFIFIAIVSLSPTLSILAFDDDPQDRGNTVEPYSVLTEGIKLRFQDIDKQYLGRRCSVYYRRGQPDGMAGSMSSGKNQFVSRNGITIENGELTGISKHSIDVTWFFAPVGARGGPIPEDEIDYVLVEKK
jgi:hypothetical protein